MQERENVESGVKKAARTIKNILRSPIKRRILVIVLAICAVIILCGAAYESLVDAFSDNVSNHVKNNPVEYSTQDNSIVITDETIDGLIKVVEDMGIDLEDLNLTREDIEKFYAAELVSSEINRGVTEETGKYYGRVYVRRLNPDTGELEGLKYEPSVEEFEKMDASEIIDYYSIEGDKICIASTETVTNEEDETTSTVTINKLSYKDDISQYTVPVEFLLDLCLISQNPEFVKALADKIINETEIVIQVLQDKTTVETETTYEYYIETEESTRNDEYDEEGNFIDSTIKTEDPVISEDSTEEITTQSRTTVNSKIKVQSVENWIMKVTYDYNMVENSNADNPDVIGPDVLKDEHKPEHKYEYSEKETHDDKSYTEIYTSSVSRKVDRTTTDKITTTTETYQSGVSEGVEDKVEEFIELLKTPYSIPNSNIKEAAIGKLENGAEMLFEMLLKGERTQTLEQLMRYILGQATGNDYGVSEFDFSVFDIKSFTPISGIYGSTVEDKVWFTLKRLGYSNEVVAGAMGNIACESSFNPTALNSGSGAYGIAQWLGGRRTKLQEYAASKETTEDDVNIQIEFLIAELTGEGDAVDFATRRTAGGKGENHYTYDDWANATTVEDAAVAYCWFYETPSTSSVKTTATMETEEKRIEAAQKYYELYKDRGTGGEYAEGSNEYGVNGYYTASNGRTFKVLNQSRISNWGDKCNRAACAIIASGYSEESSSELISSINGANRGLYGAIPPQGSSYWEKYGLQITYTEDNTYNYGEKLRSQLMSGGYALIWINNNSSTYYGKSGTKWTSLYHWLAIIDYDSENDKMCIADWRGVTWVGIDEFETHGITHFILVNEK